MFAAISRSFGFGQMVSVSSDDSRQVTAHRDEADDVVSPKLDSTLISSDSSTTNTALVQVKTSSKGMSYCRQEGADGKDVVIMVTEDDHNEPMSDKVAEMVDELITDYENSAEGPLLPNGGINWSCPCMASMVSGPCGYQFRQAFQCFHDSSEETKGIECFEHFAAMRDCFVKFPKLYGPAMSDDDDEKSERKQEGSSGSPVDPFSQSEEDIDRKLAEEESLRRRQKQRENS